MPRTKKGRHWEENEWSPDRATSETPAPITIRSMISAETRDKSRTQEETSRTTKTATKRQSAIVPTPANPPLRCEVPTCSEDDLEEVDGTPLTRADTPKIVDAILSNFSTANRMGYKQCSECCNIKRLRRLYNISLL